MGGGFLTRLGWALAGSSVIAVALAQDTGSTTEAWRTTAYTAASAPIGYRWYAGVGAGAAFVQDLDLGFSPAAKLYSPCEPSRPLQFANGLEDTLKFDVGPRVDLGLGYRISRVVSLEFQPSLIYATAPGATLVSDVIEPGYPYTVRVSRGEVELFQVPLMLGAVARFPLNQRLSAYVGADLGVVLSWLCFDQLNVECYSDEEYGKAGSGDSDMDWSFAYQAKAGLEYALSNRLTLGLGYQFLGTTEHRWNLYSDELKADAIYTHSVSLRLDFSF